jgi:hypothetical protein
MAKHHCPEDNCYYETDVLSWLLKHQHTHEDVVQINKEEATRVARTKKVIPESQTLEEMALEGLQEIEAGNYIRGKT